MAAKKSVTAKPKQKAEKQPVQKATNVPTDTNLNPSTGRMRLGAYTSPSLSTVGGVIMEEARKELRFPESIKLYKQMMLDPNIATAVGLIEALLSKVPWRVEVKDSAPEEEKQRGKKLNYNLQILDRPWREYMLEVLSYITFGFCAMEKVYQRIDSSPHGPFIGLLDLSVISQDTISKWIFDKGTGKLMGLRQDTKLIASDLRDVWTGSPTVDVPRKKFILFRHSPKRNNPEGTSPLKSCYVPWKRRNLIEEYETIGVAKDLGGVPVIGVDVTYLSKAESDPASAEAQVVEEFERRAAALHAGEQTHIILPLSYDEKGNPLFSFKLVGVEGGGKQYDTNLIIQRQDTKLLMAFFADVLKLGNDQHGSFALADSKTNILSMALESHLINIRDTFNHDLIPQLYALNGWEYNPETACKLEFGDIEKQGLEELSKFVQRVYSVGAVRKSQKVEAYLREVGFGLGDFDEDGDEEIQTTSTSRAGDGMATAGEGTSLAPSPEDESSLNAENAS